MWSYHIPLAKLFLGAVTIDFVYEATGRLISRIKPIATADSRTVIDKECDPCGSKIGRVWCLAVNRGIWGAEQLIFDRRCGAGPVKLISEVKNEGDRVEAGGDEVKWREEDGQGVAKACCVRPRRNSYLRAR